MKMRKIVHNVAMMAKRNTRRSRDNSIDTDRFSEEARRNRRDAPTADISAYSASLYGKAGRASSRRTAEEPGYGYGASSGRASANIYSRKISQSEYTVRRKKSRRKKIALAVVVLLLVMVLGGAGVAFAYFNTVSTNLSDDLDPDLYDALYKTDLSKGPFYMLLMGTDKSADRVASDEGDSFRSDSIMLARIDPIDKKVTMVSVHRDTYVELEGYGPNKLNAAYAYGGPALAVKTVSKMAGVPISHYAEINFDGFKDVVDSLGGVEVDVPMEINDEDAGGHLDAGLQKLNGDQALILCRARHAYDDYGDGDSYRAANQRLVLTAIMKKVLSADPFTMASTINTLSKYVETDLGVADIASLAQSMRGLDPAKDVYSAMEPTTSAYVGDVWYEYTDTAAWNKMMKRVDQGLPPTEETIVDESSGTVLANTGDGASSDKNKQNNSSSTQKKTKSGSVVVKNGSGMNGVASAAGSKLEAVGYSVTTGNADGYDYTQTLVIYSTPDQANDAKEMVSTLGHGLAQINDGTYAFDGDFLVVVGSDWTG